MDPPPAGRSPEEAAGFISRAFFLWMWPLVRRGHRSPLEQSDLYPLCRSDAARAKGDEFEEAYASIAAADVLKPRAYRTYMTRTARALWRVLGVDYARYALWEFLWLGMGIAQIFALRALVERVARGDKAANSNNWVYVLLAFGMFCASIVQSVCMHAVWYGGWVAGVRAQAALSTAVYRKTLRLSLASLQFTSEGQMGNLLLNDTSHVLWILVFFHFAWAGIIEVLIILGLLLIDLGPAALFGVPVLCALLLVLLPLSRFVTRSRNRIVKESDPRIQMVGEVLSGIKTVKLNAWESYFHEVIADIRRKEVRHLQTTCVLKATNAGMSLFAPLFVSLASFLTHTLLFGNILSPQITFAALAFFNLLEMVVSRLPLAFNAISEGAVSLNRLDRFFDLEELPTSSESSKPAASRDVHSNAYSKDDVPGPGFVCSSLESPRTTSRNVTPGQTPHASIVGGDFAWSPAQDSAANRSNSSEGQIPTVLSHGNEGDNKSQNDDGTGVDGCSRARQGLPIRLGVRPTWSLCRKYSMQGVSLALRSVDFQVNEGELVSVVGRVGSGKTSLLLALLGEIPLVSGTMRIHGTVAYCAQQPWIVNGTVRENITLFRGGPEKVDQPLYDRVINACCLEPDLLLLPGGDLTEIGDRGVNLSGGQKARLALARAIYSEADVYLLDDPLSAVDASVARQLNDRVLGPRGMLAAKARVIVTHQLQILPASDRVYILSGGSIAEYGTFYELVERGVSFSGIIEDNDNNVDRSISMSTASDNNGDEFLNVRDKEKLASEYREKGQGREGSDNSENQEGMQNAETFEDSASGEISLTSKELVGILPAKSNSENVSYTASTLLTVREDRRVGRVSWPVYKNFIRAGGGAGVAIVIVFFHVLAQISHLMVHWWLAQWSSDEQSRIQNDFTGGNRFYGLIYLALVVTTAILLVLRAIIFVTRVNVAGRRLHDQLLNRVLYATPTFFESNPLGRILNRFSRDVDNIDLLLPEAGEYFLDLFFHAFGALLMISWILPWFLLVLIPLGASFWFFQHWYVLSSRELKRLDGVSKSPVYAQFVETMAGLTTVRAHTAQKELTRAFENRIDENHRAFHLFNCLGRWIGIQLDMLSACTVFATSLITVVLSARLNPGLAGVALSQSLTLTAYLQWALRRGAECENLFTSVERITAMATEAPLEAPPIVPTNRPDPEWPSRGVIEFNEVVLRYRPELEPALQRLSFKTRARERIGVCGRTGAGKTSIVVALFRTVELAAGQIVIDGVDVSKIGLRDLRSRLAIVPQDPVLFQGTIRSNIDPLNAHSDMEIWEALDRVQMRERVLAAGKKGAADAEGLDVIVSGRGEDFSTGERQLLSLARAIVSGARVVVLDEATASVDRRTDGMIQQTVREHLRDRTVITVAHRLDTIADCDRILVMEGGRAVEWDTPAALLAAGGFFAHLVEETGHVERARLVEKIRQSS